MSKLFEKWHKSTYFGMFIHWGVYSITEYHEQYLMRTQADRNDYEKLYKTFNPVAYNPEEWVLMAKQAGMKYICFTAKHHDGFCMWDTKQTDYNIMNTPYNRDVLKMLQLACKKHGLKLSLYYSIPDWHHKNAYNEKSTHQIPPRDTDEPNMDKYKLFVKAQIKELLTNYGEISTFFWDIRPQYEDRTLNEFIRELQPNILINNRGFDEGDFSTPERYVPEGSIFDSPTEANESVGRQSWAYRSNEDYFSSDLLKQNIDKIIAMGANYLLNVGPTSQGTISDEAKKKLADVGLWYNSVKEAFYEGDPIVLFPNKPEILTTANNNTIYLHFHSGLNVSGTVLDPIKVLPIGVTVLNNNFTPNFALDQIPTYYQREDWNEKYLHIYNLPCDELSGKPVVLKLTFDCIIKDLFEVQSDVSESRF